MPGGALVSIEIVRVDIDIHLEWPDLGSTRKGVISLEDMLTANISSTQV